MLLFRLFVCFATNDQSLIESDSGWLPLSFVSSTAIFSVVIISNTITTDASGGVAGAGAFLSPP